MGEEYKKEIKYLLKKMENEDYLRKIYTIVLRMANREVLGRPEA